MTRELYINDRLLELDESTIIVLTYQVNDIGELEDRQANYSNMFTIPATSNNIKNLGFSNRLNSDTSIPYQKNKVNYFQNGVQLIQNGVLIVDSFDGEKFNCTVYSGVFDFFSQIGEKTFQDIDWSENDLILNLENIRDRSRDYLNDSSSNICFPLIDWGQDINPNSNRIDARYLQPCMRFSYIMDRIFELTNYSKSGEIFEDSIYNAMALTCNSSQQYEDDESLQRKSFKGTLTGLLRSTGNDTKRYAVNLLHQFRNTALDFSLYPSLDGLIVYDYSASGIVVSNPILNTGETNERLSNTRYISRTVTTLDININLFFTRHLSDDFGPQEVAFNGDVYLFHCIEVRVGSKRYIIPIRIVDGLFTTSLSVQISVGEALYITMWDGGFTLDYPYTPTGIDFTKCNISINATNTFQYGNELKFNSIMPTYRIKDFLKSFCNLFGLIVSVNEDSILFTKFKEITTRNSITTQRNGNPIFLNTPDSEDWSEMLDLSKPISIQYRYGSYGKINNMRYARKDYTSGFGDSFFEINDDVLPSESDMFELIFDAAMPRNNITNLGSYYTTVPVYEEWITYPVWYSTIPISTGGRVRNGVLVYEAVQNMSGSSAISLLDESFWNLLPGQEFGNQSLVGVKIPRYTLFSAEKWQNDTEYSIGDEVEYIGRIYVSLSENDGVPPNTSPTDWQLKYLQYEQTQDSGNAIVLIRPISTTGINGGVYYYSDGISEILINGIAMPVASFSDSSFGIMLTLEFIRDNYYLELIQMLQKLKYVNCYLRLTEIQVQNLDFTRAKYIEYFGEHFYLNKVDEFNEGSTNCELIRI